MARKKRTIIEEEPEEIPQETISIEDEAELIQQEKTQELLTEFQERFTDQPAKILIEKYDEAGDWALCQKYPLATFDQEQVRAGYGGGKYRGTLFDPNGRYVKGGRINFKFAEPLLKETATPRAENPLENPVVAMIMKSTESQNSMLLGLMQSMIAAQGAASAGGKTGMSEVLEVVKSLNQMTPKDKPMESFKESLGMIKLIKEVTGDGEPSEKGGLLGDIKEFIEIWPMVKDQLASIRPAGAVPTPAINPPSTVTIETAPKQENQAMDPLTKKVIELVPKFVGGARANAPVGEWGNYLLELFDTEILPLLVPTMKAQYKALVKDEDDVYDIILRLAADPDEREQVFKRIPPFSPYKAWVNAVIDEAVRLAQLPDPDAGGEPEPAVKVTPGGGSSILTEVEKNGVVGG